MSLLYWPDKPNCSHLGLTCGHEANISLVDLGPVWDVIPRINIRSLISYLLDFGERIT